MRALQGAPKFRESQALPDMSYADFANQVGLASEQVDDPERIGPAWDEALSANRPTVLDILRDPDVPPIPPHSTFDQVKATVSSLVSGDEDRWGVVAEGLKTKAKEIPPGRGSPG
jgi:pyruvate dehydrogenase (quinone)